MKDRSWRGTMAADRAAVLALEALAALAASETDLDRFVSQTGISAGSLRERADEPEFLVSVLDFMLANEELLIRFCDDTENDVRAVHMARHVLAGPA